VGIREKLNENQKLTTGITIAIIALTLILVLYQVMKGPDDTPKPAKAYYTVDDGATFFADDLDHAPPYDYNGKQALKALVYDCGDGNRFVVAVQRFNSKAHSKMMEYYSKPQGQRDEGIRLEFDSDRFWERKKPLTGDTGWVAASSAAGRQLLSVTCPNGGMAMQVEPPLE
jgi:hypothetical protein